MHPQDNPLSPMNLVPVTEVALPEGFPFKTNMGNRGDILFFEVNGRYIRTFEPQYRDQDGIVQFTYESPDSDEGTVTIRYQSITGDPADQTPDGEFDVEILTGSDVWGLAQTQQAILDAIALHTALGLNKRYDRDA